MRAPINSVVKFADVFDNPDFSRASQERLTSAGGVGGTGISVGVDGAAISVRGTLSGKAAGTGASSGSVFGFFLKKLNIGVWLEASQNGCARKAESASILAERSATNSPWLSQHQ
ncbi:hypothetical protein [Actimicrobium sp. CCI2.3]|uniref:hypothetical protein n=1 Tax=Actimicrobium sp. CCI2.3 TaxID=3048616 RepID=UPI002B245EF1|nr:hypothetical protein [Actimicrobium sp. CCI2.3]MEB0020509.1 hypothetical protein [Actimicrobium sp. CCI2.3]